MALVDLTNVNPWAQVNEATARANAQNQQTWAQLANTLDRAAQRRQATAERNRAQRDREYALINKETDQLVQPQTNNKMTDIQLQQLGQQFKQEYYDAVKQYEASDKGDEARQAFEQVKQRSLGSARVVSKSLENLTSQMETFREAYNDGGISDAVNPAVRKFMSDLMDPETPVDAYQIVPDPDTGDLRYVDAETGGEQVNFLLDDIANGENQFSPLVPVDMPKVITGLMKDVSDIRKEEQRDWGIASVKDWTAIGEQIEGRMDELLKDDNDFRVLAAEEGFGYEALQAVKNNETWTDVDGNEYSSIEDIKRELKSDILDKVKAVTPDVEQRAFEFQPQPTLSDQAQTEQALEKQKVLDSQIATAAKDLDVDYFSNNIVGKVKGVDRVVKKDGKIVFVTGFGKNQKVNQVFDPNKLGDLQRLSEYMGGSRDVSQLSQRADRLKALARQ